MWSSTPACVPSEWRREGATLAAAVGYGKTMGPGPRASSTFRDAYVWYSGEDSVKKTLSFAAAHEHASDLAALIRASGVAGGKLDNLEVDKPLIVGLVLKRTAALPLSQLAAFKAGATFVPCDPTWPVERTVSILCEAGASVVVADSTDSDALAVRALPQNLNKTLPRPPIQSNCAPHDAAPSFACCPMP
jgi:acyl-coenzyme A synthetase/AMP-(fatty) acid ligase